MKILMYASSQTVPESAVEDDETKNKMQSGVRNLDYKNTREHFVSQKIYV